MRGDRTSDYEFDLPRELIAQRPLDRRDASRLMIVDRANGSIRHGVFTDIADLLAHIQPKIGRDLLIARPPRMQLPPQ